MIEQLIDSMIDADNTLVVMRMKFFMNVLAQKSAEKFGTPIDPAAGHLFYVTGNPSELSAAQQAFIRELAVECQVAFRDSILNLILLTDFQKRGLLNTPHVMCQILPALLAV